MFLTIKIRNYIDKKYYTNNKPLVYCTFYKPNSLNIVPDFYSKKHVTDDWIDFPWELKS